MAATNGTRSGRAKAAAAVAAIVAMTVGFFTFAPSAFAHHPIVTGVSSCEEDGSYRIDWTVGNSELDASRYMLVRAFTVTPNAGNTTGLTADTTYDGIVGPGYAGPGTVVAPGGSVPVTTTGIPAGTASVTLQVTGFWKYGTGSHPSVVTDTREYTVQLSQRCNATSGSLTISKLVLGERAPVGATYTINYDNGAGTSGQVQLKGGESITISDIPFGTYTFSEVDAPPGYLIYPNPAVVSADTPDVKVLVKNPYPNVGEFEITKQVTGDTDGYVFGSTFTVSYECSNGTSGSVTLFDGESRTLGDLPVGTICTLNEVAKPATSGPDYVYGPEVFSPSNVVTIEQDAKVSVVLENPIERISGGFSVTKRVTGETDGYVAGSTFTVHYECANGTSGDLVLTNGDTDGVGGLPIGTMCTLTEVSKPATSGPSYVYGPEVFTPSNQITITTNEHDDVVGVTLENPIERRLGRFSVTKQVTGETDGYVPGSTFTVSYDCDGGPDGTLTLTDDQTATVSNVPTGTVCTLTEVSKPATSGPSYVYGPEVFTPSNRITVGDGTTVAVTLENPIERVLGSFSVTKQVTGATEGYVPGSEFTVPYSCDDGTTGQLVLADDETDTVDDLPIGTVCTLTEVSKPATSGPSYVYGPEVFTPSNVVTIAANDDGNLTKVTLNNPLDRLFGAFSITKQVTGETGGYVEDSTFTVSYDCDNGVDGSVTLADGETRQVADLPVGTVCTLTEVSKPATSGPSYVYGPEVFSPSNVVTVGSTSTVAVTLENPIERLFGGFSVTKQVTGATDGYVEGSTFTVHYSCDNEASGDLVLLDGDTKGVGDLPVGTVCTLEEVTKPATSGPSYVYGPEVFSPSNVVTIVANETDDVTGVTLNNPLDRLFGAFSITKQVTGETGGYVEGSTFTVSYDCDNGVDGSVTLADGETRQVADLPVGTVCTLDEVSKPATSGPSYVYGPEVFSPSNVVTVGVDTTVAVTLENPIERRLGAIAVTKVVTGATDGYVDDSEFGFTLDCSDDAFDESFTLTADETATFDGVPLGTTCTVTEVSVPEPVEGYEYQSPVLTPDDGTVTVESTTETVTVTVANPLVSVPSSTPSTPDVGVLDTTETRGALPTTGSNVTGMVILAVGLVLAGASLIGISRRRNG